MPTNTAKSATKKKTSSPKKTKGGDIVNLAPLISAVLLAAVKLSLENKKKKATANASAASAASTASKSRGRSR